MSSFRNEMSRISSKPHEFITLPWSIFLPHLLGQVSISVYEVFRVNKTLMFRCADPTIENLC